MKKLYNVNPPIHMRDSMMTHEPYYVSNTAAGLKTAAYLDDCSLAEKTELFKIAMEEGTNDLSDAYVKMKKEVAKEEDLEMEEDEYDTSDEGSFLFPTGTLLENDDEDDDAKYEEE